jgi:hypothetical protein
MDAIVLEHEYKQVSGGISAEFKIIKGSNATPPQLTNPTIQILIGYLSLPANCTKLSDVGVKYIKSKSPAFANSLDFVLKENGFFITNLDGRGNRITNLGNPINPYDASTKYYVDEQLILKVRQASELVQGIVELADKSEAESATDDFKAMTPLKTKFALDSRIATQEESNEDTSQSKLITPKTLSNRTSTETRSGIIKIATEQEISNGTSDSTAITPYKLNKKLKVSPIVVELGPWNIDSIPDITISHDFSSVINSICGLEVTIVADDSSRHTFNGLSQVTSSNLILEKLPNSFSGTNFNNASINRGYAIVWINLESVNRQSNVIVNAGADQYYKLLNLQYSNPILNTLLVKSRSGADYSLNVNLTPGDSTDLSNYKLQFKKSTETVWSTTTQSIVDDTDFNCQLLGVNFEDWDFRLTAFVAGSNQQIYSNILTFNPASIGISQINSSNSFSGNLAVVRNTFNLSGYSESTGSVISNTEWEVVSKPLNSIVTFNQSVSDNLVVDFSVSDYGTYVFKLTATDGLGVVNSDTVEVKIDRLVNSIPTAVLQWASDGTVSPKSVAWQIYDGTIGAYYGFYQSQLRASASSDTDGSIVEYYWEVMHNNDEWNTLLHWTRNFAPVHELREDGNWKYRCLVKDNLGGFSNYSNILELNITGTRQAGNPLSVFNLVKLSGGSEYGTWQLSIAPISRVASLTHRIYDAYTARGMFLRVRGNGTAQYGDEGGRNERDVTGLKTSNMYIDLQVGYARNFWGNIVNHYYVYMEWRAKDILGNTIGYATMGVSIG